MPLKDAAGNKIAGYRCGPYWFQVTDSGRSGPRIEALCGQYYLSEEALVSAWDAVHGSYPDSPKSYPDSPKLIRVYAEGAEYQIRPRVD